MKIYCCVCNTYVGEVRDANLMKNLAYLCPYCKDIAVGKRNDKNDVDILKEIFGMKK